MKIFVGIDVSEKSFSACAVNNKVEKLFEFSAPISREGFHRLVKKLSDFPKEDILIGKESSGCYHVTLWSFLVSRGYKTLVINPIIISNFIKLNLRKTKTDKKDAFSIAKFLALYHQHIPDTNIDYSEMREIARERENLSRSIAKIKNDIEKLISVLFPELPDFVNVFSNGILNLLENAPSARSITRLSLRKIFKLINKPSRKGRHPNITSEKIFSLAKNSVGITSKAKEIVLRQKIYQLKIFQTQMEKLTDILKEICEETALQDLEILRSIKGVGDITAMHLIAEMGTVKRFSNHKKLIAYAGLDPTVYESGQFKGEKQAL